MKKSIWLYDSGAWEHIKCNKLLLEKLYKRKHQFNMHK